MSREASPKVTAYAALGGLALIAALILRRPELAALGATGLRHLGLCLVEAGDGGVEALAAAPWLAGLRCLDLSQNKLTERSAQALASVRFERIAPSTM